MNAETRAKEIWKGLTEFCEGPAESIRLIEHALIAAENDKLEEAAQLLRNHALTHLPPDTQLIALCARSVLTLKSKD